MWEVILNPLRRKFFPYTFSEELEAIDFAVLFRGYVVDESGKIIHDYRELPFNA